MLGKREEPRTPPRCVRMEDSSWFQRQRRDNAKYCFFFGACGQAVLEAWFVCMPLLQAGSREEFVYVIHRGYHLWPWRA